MTKFTGAHNNVVEDEIDFNNINNDHTNVAKKVHSSRWIRGFILVL